MEEKPPQQTGREVPRARNPRAAFSTPEQPAPQSKPAERAPRRAAKAPPAVTFQPPISDDSAAESVAGGTPRRRAARKAPAKKVTGAETVPEGVAEPRKATKKVAAAREAGEAAPVDRAQPAKAPAEAAKAPAEPAKAPAEAAKAPGQPVKATKATAAKKTARKAAKAPSRSTAAKAQQTTAPVETENEPGVVRPPADKETVPEAVQAPAEKGAEVVPTKPPTVEPPAATPADADWADAHKADAHKADGDRADGDKVDADRAEAQTAETEGRARVQLQAASIPAARTEAWAKIVADPGHAPELLALAAIQTIGPRAREWVQRMGEDYPTAPPDALARLAVAQFTRVGGVGSAFAAVAGTYAPIALLGANAYTYAELILHVAAAYGLDPTAPERAVELLVLTQVHPTAEDAEAALATARQPAYEDDAKLTDAVWRLGRMATAQAAVWTVLKGVNRFFPGTAMLAAIMTSRSGVRNMGMKATRFYRERARQSASSL